MRRRERNSGLVLRAEQDRVRMIALLEEIRQTLQEVKS